MSKGEKTRAAILDAALDRASTLGLEGLSIGALAKDMGMSKSGLFAHFKSKEDLQLQVLDHAAAQFVEVVMAPAFKAPRGRPRVEALLEGWLAWGSSDRFSGGCVFMSAAAEYDDRPGPLRESARQKQKDYVDAVATAVTMAQSEGHFRADLDPTQFAYEAYGTMLAFHLYNRLFGDDRAAHRARTALGNLVEAARIP